MLTAIAPMLSLAIPVGIIIKMTNWKKIWKGIKQCIAVRLHTVDETYEPIYNPSNKV